MAHKKGEGSVKNGRDSQSKRLGVKIYGGQPAIAGNQLHAAVTAPAADLADYPALANQYPAHAVVAAHSSMPLDWH